LDFKLHFRIYTKKKVKSLENAYHLFEARDIEKITFGTFKYFQQTHHYPFDALNVIACSVWTKHFSKGGFISANSLYLTQILSKLELTLENFFKERITQNIELNIAHHLQKAMIERRSLN